MLTTKSLCSHSPVPFSLPTGPTPPSPPHKFSIFVGNLPTDATKEGVTEFFAPCGEITRSGRDGGAVGVRGASPGDISRNTEVHENALRIV